MVGRGKRRKFLAALVREVRIGFVPSQALFDFGGMDGSGMNDWQVQAVAGKVKVEVGRR